MGNQSQDVMRVPGTRLNSKRPALDDGWKFLIGLLVIPALLIAIVYGVSHRQVVAARRAVAVLFPLNAPVRIDEGQQQSLVGRDALDSLRILKGSGGSLVTIHEEVLGSDPFGPCLAKISIRCDKKVYRFLAYFYSGRCDRLETDYSAI